MANPDVVGAQGLECCICFEYFDEPKNLSCGHSFCEKCLNNLCESQQQHNQLSCPICRTITKVSDGDVSKLQTNYSIKSMVDEVKARKKICTSCDPEANSPAAQFCVQCQEYMCDPCSVVHGKFKMTKNHDVVSMDDAIRGRVGVKRFCSKHQEEEKRYVCTSCNVSICFKCRMLSHNNSDHEIKDVSDYQNSIRIQITSLQNEAMSKIALINAHAELVKKQESVVEEELDHNIAEINQSYEEAVKHLKRQRNDLIEQGEHAKATYIAKLEKIKESDDKEMSCIQRASELVGNGNKALLEGQGLKVHNRIRDNLEKLLNTNNPDKVLPKSIADHARSMKFIKSGTPTMLGEWQQSDWQLREVSTYPLSHELPFDAVPLPDGQVVIGYHSGKAIEMFSVDGSHGTVLRGVKVIYISVLADGRYVVCDYDNNITLYTRKWEKLNVQFKTLSWSDGGWGGLCVDRDVIYVGYSMKRKIAVFRSEGGEPFRWIHCQDFTPLKIHHMNHSRRLVVCDGSKFVRVIDDTDGKDTVIRHIQVNGRVTDIAVLKDDNIIVGCKENDRLSIQVSTKDLQGFRTVLKDFPVLDVIYRMVELPSGEIVLVAEMKFIVLQKI